MEYKREEDDGRGVKITVGGHVYTYVSSLTDSQIPLPDAVPASETRNNLFDLLGFVPIAGVLKCNVCAGPSKRYDLCYACAAKAVVGFLKKDEEKKENTESESPETGNGNDALSE